MWIALAVVVAAGIAQVIASRGGPVDDAGISAEEFAANRDRFDKAGWLGRQLGCPAETLEQGFLEGTRIGAPPVAGGVALTGADRRAAELSRRASVTASGSGAGGAMPTNS